MSRGINKTISIGNLCADPETRYLPSGAAVTNIRIAELNHEQGCAKETADKVVAKVLEERKEILRELSKV